MSEDNSYAVRYGTVMFLGVSLVLVPSFSLIPVLKPDAYLSSGQCLLIALALSVFAGILCGIEKRYELHRKGSNKD